MLLKSTYLHFQIIQQILIILRIVQIKKVILHRPNPLLFRRPCMLFDHSFESEQFLLKSRQDFHFPVDQYFGPFDILQQIRG